MARQALARRGGLESCPAAGTGHLDPAGHSAWRPDRSGYGDLGNVLPVKGLVFFQCRWSTRRWHAAAAAWSGWAPRRAPHPGAEALGYRLTALFEHIVFPAPRLTSDTSIHRVTRSHADRTIRGRGRIAVRCRPRVSLEQHAPPPAGTDRPPGRPAETGTTLTPTCHLWSSDALASNSATRRPVANRPSRSNARGWWIPAAMQNRVQSAGEWRRCTPAAVHAPADALTGTRSSAARRQIHPLRVVWTVLVAQGGSSGGTPEPVAEAAAPVRDRQPTSSRCSAIGGRGLHID